MRARLLIVLDDLVKIFKPRNAVLLLAQALRRDQTQVLAPQAELADAARERLTADLEQFFRLGVLRLSGFRQGTVGHNGKMEPTSFAQNPFEKQCSPLSYKNLYYLGFSDFRNNRNNKSSKTNLLPLP